MGIATPNKLVVEHRLGDNRYGDDIQAHADRGK